MQTYKKRILIDLDGVLNEYGKEKYDENNLDKYFKDVTNIKIPSFLHIDDRAVCFGGDYTQTLFDIKMFKTYWKN